MNKLRILPVKRSEKLNHIRTFANSKTTYGWIGKTPPEKETTKLTSLAWKVGGNLRCASRHLKNVLEGATMDVGAMIGTRQIGLQAGRMKRQGNETEIWWTNATGTLSGEIRKWMKKHRWEEQKEWKWKHRKK